MCKKDAAKARIQKLEGELLGLVYRLKNLGTHSGLFSNVSQSFNNGSAKANLNKRFHAASRLEDTLKLQIAGIHDELSALLSHRPEELEFNMAA